MPAILHPWAMVIFVCALVCASADGSFRPHAALNLRELERLVRDASPDMRDSVRQVREQEAQQQSNLQLENPVLALSVGTIPLGSSNPPGLNAVSDVMNYGGSLSYHFEVVKRGRRQSRDRALVYSERARDRRTLRLTALGFARVLGDLAATRMKMDYVAQLIDDARLALTVAEERAKNGAAAGLEADRMQIEVFRYEQQLREAEATRGKLLAECARYMSRNCEPFADATAAREFLDAWLKSANDTAPVTKRMDLRQLEALAAAAERSAELARGDRIPDFTLSLGYLHDRFVISGNQMNSLNVALSVPLPFFSYGQAEEGLAEMRKQSLADERELRLRVADARISILRANMQTQKERRETLEGKMLPRARTVVSELEKSLQQRLISTTDVLSARRALFDLLLAQAESFTDSFDVLIDLLAELPED